MEKKRSKKRQHGDSRRQKMRSSFDVPQSTSHSGAPSSSRLIHADAFLKFFYNKDNPHRSFHRTYREDYVRELNVPGYGEHIVETFRMVFQNLKLFGPLLLLAVILELLVVGATNETVAVFTILIFLMIWLTGIFLVRQRKAGREVTFKDGLYNAMAPLMSSVVIFAVMVVECMPIMLVIIAYDAAMRTDFLTMPAYALLFWGVAGLLITLSGYLLSSSLIAFIAVSAPGLYPWKALTTATELMMGRRVRFILRLIALCMVLTVIGAAVVLPLMAMRAPVWLMTGAVVVMGGFGAIFATVYLYLYYRYLLNT